MAEVLEKVYGQTLDVLVREKIWKPSGCEHPAFWGKDTEGGDFKAFCCFYATARDFGHMASLYSDSGKWNGRQLVPRILASEHYPALLKDHDKLQQALRLLLRLMELDGKPVYHCRGYHGEYGCCAA
ncbi:MAG: hypothetical protein IPO90_07880 [Flavobacteriales bacterium]|nr:hypothetical protein [Flavobacteriales bacterium]